MYIIYINTSKNLSVPSNLSIMTPAPTYNKKTRSCQLCLSVSKRRHIDNILLKTLLKQLPLPHLWSWLRPISSDLSTSV